eukprot:g704.t1
MEWIRVGSSDDLRKRLHVKVRGRFLTIIRGEGRLYCIDSICYHAGGPLGLGDIEESDGHLCIKCPWHHYALRLDDGKKMSQGLSVVEGKLVPTGWQTTASPLQRTHPVEIRSSDGGVYVRLGPNNDENVVRSDAYAFNEAAGAQVMRCVDTRAGSDGVSGKCNMPPKKRTPSGQVLARQRRTRKVVPKVRSSGTLKFRVEPPPSTKMDVVKEEEEEETVSTPLRDRTRSDSSEPRVRSRRVLLERGYSEMDWVRHHMRRKPSLERGRALPKIGPKELAAHRSKTDMWIAIRGYVYDVTDYLKFHPGGVEELLRGAGEDATAIFNEVHGWVQAKEMLKKLCVGEYDSTKTEEKGDDDADALAWVPHRVICKRTVARNTFLMTVRRAEDAKQRVPALTCGQHVHLTVRATDGRHRPYRAYTPVDVRDDEMDFCIKVYPDGNLTPHLGSLKASSIVFVRGPRGTVRYIAPGLFRVAGIRGHPRDVRAKRISMIAGGTGITPMLQILRHICASDADSTQVRLLFCNRRERDIMLRDVIERAVAADKNDRIRVAFSLSDVKSVPKDWTGERGPVCSRMLQKTTFAAPDDDDSIALICGPPGFNAAVRSALSSIGLREGRVFEF